MDNFKEENKNEYDGSSESDYDEEELQCKNIDPLLAKLMGIIIEEQNNNKIEWKPPSKSGLDNSEQIISSIYFKNKNSIEDIDFFKVIKNDILNYKTLTTKQLDYIKNLNNDEKFELIEIYNKLMDTTVKNLES
jgi:hypothetical protein